MYKVFLEIQKEELDHVKRVCENIKMKDKTFDYGFEFDTIVLYCKSKNVAFKRGLWFKYRVKGVVKFVVSTNDVR